MDNNLETIEPTELDDTSGGYRYDKNSRRSKNIEDRRGWSRKRKFREFLRLKKKKRSKRI